MCPIQDGHFLLVSETKRRKAEAQGLGSFQDANVRHPAALALEKAVEADSVRPAGSFWERLNWSVKESRWLISWLVS